MRTSRKPKDKVSLTFSERRDTLESAQAGVNRIAAPLESPEKPTTLRALIFDVDGTLDETESAHRATFNDAFAEGGLDWHWDEPLYARLLEVSGGKECIVHYWSEVRGAVPTRRAAVDRVGVQRGVEPGHRDHHLAGQYRSLDAIGDRVRLDIDVPDYRGRLHGPSEEAASAGVPADASEDGSACCRLPGLRGFGQRNASGRACRPADDRDPQRFHGAPRFHRPAARPAQFGRRDGGRSACLACGGRALSRHAPNPLRSPPLN
jgi:hypothetical protein